VRSELRDLRIDFVSLTSAGADQDAHVMLAKTAPDPAEESHMSDLAEPIRKALGDEAELTEEQAEALNAAFDEARSAVPEGYVEAPAEGAEDPAAAAEDGGESSDDAAGEPAPTEVDVTKSAEFVELKKRLDAEVRARRERDFVDEPSAEDAHLPGDATAITKSRGGSTKARDRRGRFTRARHRDQPAGEQRTPGQAPALTTEERLEADLAATDGRLDALLARERHTDASETALAKLLGVRERLLYRLAQVRGETHPSPRAADDPDAAAHHPGEPHAAYVLIPGTSADPADYFGVQERSERCPACTYS